MPKPLGVVDVLVSRKPPEHGLPQHADQRMTAVLAGPSVSENLACHHAEAERVAEFPVREQTGAGDNYRSPKLEHQTAVARKVGGPSRLYERAALDARG